jgi:hypothetical protein
MKTKRSESKTHQRKALALISLRVKEGFRTIIEDAKESETRARKAWETFEEMFRSVTTGRKLMLQGQMSSLK